MTFWEYLQKINAPERKIIEKRLTDLIPESSIMRQMVNNLYSEIRFKEFDCKELAENLLNSPSGNEKTELIIRDFCRANRCLKGDEAMLPSDSILGRIVSFERFCELMVESWDHLDIDEAKEYLRRIIMNLPPDQLPDEWKNTEIGKHIMWSTFDENGGLPFGNPRPDVAFILCSLGLAIERGPFILFEYKLPIGIKPHVPTFCDAYAGDFWTAFFRTSPPGSSWGYTMPTEIDEEQKPLPEVVHVVIKAENLVDSLRFA